MSSPILLSFIVPVFNKEKLLNKCIASIYNLKQFINLNKEIEIVTINDCSTDKSYLLLKKWKKKIKNFKIINLKSNKGVSFARNAGIKNSVGNYIFFVDSDDSIETKNFKKTLKLIKKNLSKDVFLFYNIIKNGNFIIKPKINKTKKEKTFSESISSTNSNLINWNVWRTIIKRKFIKNNKIYFKNLHHFEDWIFIATLISCKPKFLKIKKYLYTYSLKMNNSETRLLNVKNLINTIKTYEYLKKINIKFNHGKKVINHMMSGIREILFVDLFWLKKSKILLYKKKYPFLIKIINKNIKFRNAINKNSNKILLFCAGRFGRTFSKLLPKKNLGKKIIIDENPAFYDFKINGFKIKNFNFLLKNRREFSDYKFIICNTNKEVAMGIEKKILGKRFTKNQIVSINRTKYF